MEAQISLSKDFAHIRTIPRYYYSFRWLLGREVRRDINSANNRETGGTASGSVIKKGVVSMPLWLLLVDATSL
jgi:hypothetical protein